MCYMLNFPFIVLTFFVIVTNAIPTFRLTNFRCVSHNKTLAEFSICRFQPVNRYVQEIHMKLILHYKPINNFTLIAKFNRRSDKHSPYNPLIRDVKVDACEYMIKRNNLILNSLYKIWSKYSNINHTCPFDNDLLITGMRLDAHLLEWVPFPSGDYAFFSRWYMNRKPYADLDFFFNFE